MEYLLQYLVPGLWALFYAVWGLAALNVKEAQRSETWLLRLAILLVELFGFALVLTRWFRIGPLAWRFLPDTPARVIAGVLVEALGIGFAILARLYLGRNWSGTVTIKVDHELISAGPYALSRHPIYTGVLLGFLGTAIAYGEIRGLVGLALVALAYWRKMSVEEKYLTEEFGATYSQYRRRVKALIPFIL